MAEEYLATRGFAHPDLREIVDLFRLGYVADPLPGHEMYRGMIAIPYIRQSMTKEWAVVSIRFRCIQDHEHKGHGKYNTVAGDRPRLYNTVSLLRSHDSIAVCEGEIDTITARACGIEAVGVPGASAWQPHFREPFVGYETVYVLVDGDDAGMRFGRTVVESLSNAKLIPCPSGHDVNSWVLDGGFHELRGRLGIA